MSKLSSKVAGSCLGEAVCGYSSENKMELTICNFGSCKMEFGSRSGLVAHFGFRHTERSLIQLMKITKCSEFEMMRKCRKIAIQNYLK